MDRTDIDITADLSVGGPRRAMTRKFSRRRVHPKGVKENLLPGICKQQIRNDIMNAALAFASIMVVYYESEEFYREHSTTENGVKEVTKESNESNLQVNVMRGVSMLLSAVIVYLIYRHYKFELRKMVARKQVPSHASFRLAKLRTPMIIEMTIFGITCPPYLDWEFSGSMLNGTYTYSIDSLLAIVNVLRVFLIARLYAHFSIWMSEEAFIIGKKVGLTPSIMFSIKADLKHQPYVIISGAIAFTIIFIGFAVRNLERPFESNDKSSLDFEYLTNGWWLTVVTMTTVGYGDGYPSTHLGRFIMLVTAVISLIVVSLYVVALTVASMFSKEETKAYYMINKHKATSKAQERAANVIKCSFRLKDLLVRKENTDYLKKIFMCGAVLRRHMHNFSRETNLANTRYLPPSELLVQLEQKLITDINEIRKEIIDIQFIGERFDELMKRQQSVAESLDDILDMQNAIESEMTQLDIMKKLHEDEY